MYATDDTSADYYQSAKNVNNYGGMQYYSSSTCYSIGFTGDSSGCTGNYNQSHIKYVVDAWAADNSNFASTVLKEVDGYKARLITVDELVANMGYVLNSAATAYNLTPDTTPDWVWNSQYIYWTMSPNYDRVWTVQNSGHLNGDWAIYNIDLVVRPVINLSKSAISS